MSSVTTSPNFDHSSIDIRDVNARRAHMKAFFLHLGLWNEELEKEFRADGEEQACEVVDAAGYGQINQAYFELMVDNIVWFNLLDEGDAHDQGHDWPWDMESAVDSKDLTTYGSSKYYREWRRRKASAEVQHLISTARIVNLQALHQYHNDIPTDTQVECLFSGVSTQFPHHRIKSLAIEEVKRYVVGIMEGAFPSRTKLYTDDEILLRTNYRLIQG
ncbi:hypothetical protein F25303_11763 [Fusarium sp. NRRL 25303]|nr:hypothetical protein F25303_11763 [Fusarium sp. NRRL 25303]